MELVVAEKSRKLIYLCNPTFDPPFRVNKGYMPSQLSYLNSLPSVVHL